MRRCVITQQIADTVKQLRNMGFTIGLKHNGKVSIRYPGGKKPAASELLLEGLRSNRASTVEYLKEFMIRRKEEFREAVDGLFENDEIMFEFDIAQDKDFRRAVGCDGVLFVYKDAAVARDAQEKQSNVISADVLVELWMAAVYEPESLRWTFVAKKLFEGEIVG